MAKIKLIYEIEVNETKNLDEFYECDEDFSLSGHMEKENVEQIYGILMKQLKLNSKLVGYKIGDHRVYYK